MTTKKNDNLEIVLTPTERVAIRNTMALRDAVLVELQTAQRAFRQYEDELAGVAQAAVKTADKPFDGMTWKINDNTATMLIGERNETETKKGK